MELKSLADSSHHQQPSLDWVLCLARAQISIVQGIQLDLQAVPCKLLTNPQTMLVPRWSADIG